MDASAIYVDWQTEVAHWRADPTYEIRVAPEYWIGVVLTREHANADLPAYIDDSNNNGSKLIKAWLHSLRYLTFQHWGHAADWGILAGATHHA